MAAQEDRPPSGPRAADDTGLEGLQDIGNSLPDVDRRAHGPPAPSSASGRAPEAPAGDDDAVGDHAPSSSRPTSASLNFPQFDPASYMARLKAAAAAGAVSSSPDHAAGEEEGREEEGQVALAPPPPRRSDSVALSPPPTVEGLMRAGQSPSPDGTPATTPQLSEKALEEEEQKAGPGPRAGEENQKSSEGGGDGDGDEIVAPPADSDAEPPAVPSKHESPGLAVVAPPVSHSRSPSSASTSSRHRHSELPPLPPEAGLPSAGGEHASAGDRPQPALPPETPAASAYPFRFPAAPTKRDPPPPSSGRPQPKVDASLTSSQPSASAGPSALQGAKGVGEEKGSSASSIPEQINTPISPSEETMNMVASAFRRGPSPLATGSTSRPSTPKEKALPTEPVSASMPPVTPRTGSRGGSLSGQQLAAMEGGEKRSNSDKEANAATATPRSSRVDEMPFDFNRFLEQMKHRSAQPVGEYVRSFIKGFSKKPYRVNDQIKLIFDFLDFISERMRECEVWRDLSEREFDNATEAMEKLVMNRLYPFTFTPVVDRTRGPIVTDDLERDHVLRQRIRLFSWIREEHLDVPTSEHSAGFISFAQQELLKINHYKAPRDKLICILNCCKVIFGLIRHLSGEENADTFVPVLIFVVLRANPEHLVSNIEYINRFRNPDKLSSESGYYLSSLMGAVSFIETMDHSSLSNITQAEFERNVENAVQNLASAPPSPNPTHYPDSQQSLTLPPSTSSGEDSARALPFTPSSNTFADDTRAFFARTGERAGEVGKAAAAGISKPLGVIGKFFNDAVEQARSPDLAGKSSSFPRRFGGWPFESGEDESGTGGSGAREQDPNWGSAWSRSSRPGTGTGQPQQHLAPTPLRQGPPWLQDRYHAGSSGIGTPSDLGGLSPSASPAPGTPTPADRDYSPSLSPGYLQQHQQPFASGYPGANARQRYLYAQREALQSHLYRQAGDRQQYRDRDPPSPVPTPQDLQAMTTQIDHAAAERLRASVETLRSIFPDVEEVVCEGVLESVEGDVGRAVEALLEMSQAAGAGRSPNPAGESQSRTPADDAFGAYEHGEGREVTEPGPPVGDLIDIDLGEEGGDATAPEDKEKASS